MDNNIKTPAIFLDRDGTINYDYGYTYKFTDFKFRPYVLKGLRYLSKKKYLIFIRIKTLYYGFQTTKNT